MYKNGKVILLSLILISLLLSCSKSKVHYQDNVVKIIPFENSFCFVTENNGQFSIFDFQTNEIICKTQKTIDELIKVNGEIILVDDEDSGVYLYDLNSDSLNYFEASLVGKTDSTIVLSSYFQSPKRELERQGKYPIYDRLRIRDYPKREEIIGIEIQRSVFIKGELYRIVLDTLGVNSYYNSCLQKLRDVRKDEFIGAMGQNYYYSQPDDETIILNDIAIDLSNHTYEKILSFNFVNGDVIILAQDNENVYLTNHEYKVIEKVELEVDKEYCIFSNKGEYKIGVREDSQDQWFMPTVRDSIYEQITVRDSILYEHYLGEENNAYNHRIANEENHYDSFSKPNLILENAYNFVNDVRRPLFIVKNDDVVLLNMKLDVVYNSSDTLVFYSVNGNSILMLLRDESNDRTYFSLYEG